MATYTGLGIRSKLGMRSLCYADPKSEVLCRLVLIQALASMIISSSTDGINEHKVNLTERNKDYSVFLPSISSSHDRTISRYLSRVIRPP